jgi:hypothetical protein
MNQFLLSCLIAIPLCFLAVWFVTTFFLVPKTTLFSQLSKEKNGTVIKQFQKTQVCTWVFKLFFRKILQFTCFFD